MKNDRRAVRGLKEKDEAAFEYLYHKYVRLVHHVIFMIVENREDTKDLVQDTFIKAANSINSFNPRNNFKYWLLTIAKNNAYDFLRKERRITTNYDLDKIPYYPIDEKQEFDELLEKYKNIITKDEYNIITLHLFENLKFREIAKIYDKSTSAVNNIYIRGRNKIRNHLKEVEQNERH